MKTKRPRIKTTHIHAFTTVVMPKGHILKLK